LVENQRHMRQLWRKSVGRKPEDLQRTGRETNDDHSSACTPRPTRSATHPPPSLRPCVAGSSVAECVRVASSVSLLRRYQFHHWYDRGVCSPRPSTRLQSV